MDDRTQNPHNAKWMTFLLEVAYTVNCRPLSAMVEDETITPLRPIDFIAPGEGPAELQFNRLPKSDNNDPDFILKKNQTELMQLLHSTFIRNTQLLTQFQTTFKEQYLLELRERHAQIKSFKGMRPQEGDVVSIQTHRNGAEVAMGEWITESLRHCLRMVP